MDEREVDVQCGGASTQRCAIKLDGVYCDGHVERQSIGVFSHFHEDHIGAISDCIGTYDVLLTHPITFECIDALKPGMRHREQWVTSDYDTAYKFSGGTIRLLKSNHIPGSAQVHVESGSTSMLYSGDFNYPDIQIRHAEHLVLDSSHGDPWWDGRTDRKSVKNRMFKHVKDVLDSNKQVIVQAPSGTLQEIVRHFEVSCGRRLGDDVSFIMEKKQERVLHKIYRGDRPQFRNVVQYGEPECDSMLQSSKKCVIFMTDLVLDARLRNRHKVMVDRYRFGKDESPIIEFEGGCRFNLSAHASINGIYSYIEDVGPKHVVTDNSRGSHARTLAKLIEQRFPNIRTEFRPPHS